MLSGVFSEPSTTCAKVTGAPSGVPSAANRLTVCTSYCVNAPTVSGVRSANLPNPPRRMPRPSGSRLTDMPDARRVVDALDDIVAVGADAQLEIQPIVDAPAILREERELGAADFGVASAAASSVVRSASEPSRRTTSTCWL